MPVTSPIVSLYSVLQTVRASAEANAPLLRKNEAATRAALIDPVLRALGWDTANVQMVIPEHTVENKQKLDYVLRGAEGNVSVIIEAKKLDESLDKLGHVGAVIGYAFSLKPEIFLITDGIHWHCYSPTHSSYHPVDTISLHETPAIEASLRLIQWLDAAHSGHGMMPVVTKSNFSLPDATVSAPAKKLKALRIQPEIKLIASEFIELHQLNLRQLPDQKPKQLRLPDGTVKELKSWKDILVQASLYVLQHHPQLSMPYPDRAGKKTFLFNWQKPAAGIGNQETSLGGRKLFIHTNYSARDCVANAIHALKLAPIAEQKVVPAVAF